MKPLTPFELSHRTLARMTHHPPRLPREREDALDRMGHDEPPRPELPREGVAVAGPLERAERAEIGLELLETLVPLPRGDVLHAHAVELGDIEQQNPRGLAVVDDELAHEHGLVRAVPREQGGRRREVERVLRREVHEGVGLEAADGDKLRAGREPRAEGGLLRGLGLGGDLHVEPLALVLAGVEARVGARREDARVGVGGGEDVHLRRLCTPI